MGSLLCRQREGPWVYGVASPTSPEQDGPDSVSPSSFMPRTGLMCRNLFNSLLYHLLCPLDQLVWIRLIQFGVPSPRWEDGASLVGIFNFTVQDF
jgi:hypothetical protein